MLPPGESVRILTIIARFPNPPSFDAPAQGILSEFLDETYTAHRRGMGLLYGKNCMILTSTIFDWSTRVMDRQTDGFAIAYSALSMLSCAKNTTRRPIWYWDLRSHCVKGLTHNTHWTTISNFHKLLTVGAVYNVLHIKLQFKFYTGCAVKAFVHA